MKKMIGILLMILFLSISMIMPIRASVATTEEPTGGQTVYIAGNPSLYPLEYYDNELGKYAGLIPEVFEKISMETGIPFTYVRGGIWNQQKRMAKNEQIEIVSVHYEDEIPQFTNKYPLFSYEDGDETKTVCIAFTWIADPEMEKMVVQKFQEVSREEYLRYAMRLTRKNAIYAPMLFLAAVLILVITLYLIVRTKNKKKKEIEEHNRMTDLLTGIGNKEYFEYSFLHYIPERAQELYYLAYVSINMKKLRQYFNESIAEEIQKYAANILSTSCRDDDFTARIGDGVFLVAFLEADTEKAQTRAKEWISRLNQYEHQMMQEYRIAFAAGIHPLGKAKIDLETAVFNARQGYLFASDHDLMVSFSDEKILNWELTNKRLKQKLIDAIANQEFRLYLQFVVDSHSEKIVAAEALTRWYNPEDGVLTPNYYVENLIDLGIIDQLDFWVLDKVCARLEAWNGTENQDIHISCNFTRQTFAQENFLERFLNIIQAHDFDHKLLTLELTEDVLVDNSELIYKNITGVREEKCLIALDDFGSGYTSFCDLCDYPIDIIKIDRTIILKGENERARAVLQGVSSVAHDMDMSVLCEGVETQEQLELVRYINCDMIQGYRFSRVFPEEEGLKYMVKYEKRRLEHRNQEEIQAESNET